MAKDKRLLARSSDRYSSLALVDYAHVEDGCYRRQCTGFIASSLLPSHLKDDLESPLELREHVQRSRYAIGIYHGTVGYLFFEYEGSASGNLSSMIGDEEFASALQQVHAFV